MIRKTVDRKSTDNFLLVADVIELPHIYCNK